MKKVGIKMMILAVAVSAVASGVGVGTYARYVSRVQSSENVVNAAKFEVSPGNNFAERSFNIENIYPGSGEQQYDITVDKNDTCADINIEYSISVQGEEEENSIFKSIKKGNKEIPSPIQFQLQRKINDKYETIVENILNNSYTLNDLNEDNALRPAKVEDFRLVCKWNEGDHDIDFQGKTGKFNVIFNTQQVDGPHIEIKTLKDVNTAFVFDNDVNYHTEKGTVVLSPKYYVNADGLRVIEIGDVTKEDINLNIKNLVLTEISNPVDKYNFVATCEYEEGNEFLCNGMKFQGKHYPKSPEYAGSSGYRAFFTSPELIPGDSRKNKQRILIYPLNEEQYNWFE